MTAVQPIPGAAGAAGAGALGVDVWASQGNPASVTDWGPIINTLLAGANKHLSFGFGHTFPFSTKINLDDLSGIVFETASSAAHVVQPQTKLLWKGGVGSGNALSMKHADGCEIGVSIEYDHTTGYNGDLILVDVNAGGAQGSRNLFKRAMFGSDDIGTTHTARSILNFAAAVDCTVEECMIVGAQWTVRGRETGIPLAHTDNNNFLRCGFNAATSGFFCNVGENWTIEGCTFEFGSLLSGFKTPSVFDSDMTHTSTFEFIGNRLWDFVDATQTPISQKSQNTWNAVISRNFIDTAGGVNISLLGPGSVTVEDNRFSRSASNGGTALIDLGSSVSAYKAYARIKGNVWSASSLPANVIANISGHGIVDIGPNSEDSGFPAQAQSVRTFVGHERTYWPTAYSSTIAMAAGQPATTLDGAWGDSFGFITIQPTGGNTVAGFLATITFGTAMEPSVAGVPNPAHKVPLVNVWPYAVTGDGVNLAASWDAGFMVEVVNTQQATWRLHTRNVVPSGTKIGFGYRVVQL